MDKTYHVRKNTDIEAILKRKDSVGDSYFVVYKLENKSVPHLRFAISASKKFGNAVQRNRIRRRIREVVYHAGLRDEYDFFIVVKPAASLLEFSDIESDLKKLFARAKLLRSVGL